jgi:hypothetical protein
VSLCPFCQSLILWSPFPQTNAASIRIMLPVHCPEGERFEIPAGDTARRLDYRIPILRVFDTSFDRH